MYLNKAHIFELFFLLSQGVRESRQAKFGAKLELYILLQDLAKKVSYNLFNQYHKDIYLYICLSVCLCIYYGFVHCIGYKTF